jgi:flavin reductase (DIM6/NTAB) family NADH-FMN oxidoreductase RutF
MEISARRIPPGEDLRHLQGVTFAPCVTIRPPRIVEAKVAFECQLDRIVTIGDGAGGGNLILGRIQRMHVADDLVTGSREIDWRGLNPLGRLSGNRYCDIHSVIESETH